MRIAAVNSYHARVGGAETYLDTVIPALAAGGHQIAFVSELDSPPGVQAIRLPATAPAWCAAEMGWPRALAALESWRPDVIYVHGMNDLPAAARMVASAPAVLFAHGYYGTCISGAKMFSAPRPRPCARRFGWRCFTQYYPHRCGGLNPLRMWNDYRKQSARFALLRRYAAILTASAHMRDEFVRHGLPPQRVHALRLPIAPARLPGLGTAQAMPAENRELRLLYVGRMTRLKGGTIMLEALAPAAASLGRPLKVTFVGDGPDRGQWEHAARRVQAANTNLKIEFGGLLNAVSLDRLMLDSDLLVVPSTWPEPFGLVGPEAGRHGLPAAAFAVGGIPEWLSDGINGHLAPGDPPSAAGLARAIVECVRDPAELARLRHGARELSSRFNLDAHMDALLAIFEGVIGVNPNAAASEPAS
ncbi:MAG TPA: glycosyltransferase family 4 protein [Candidatus Binataceae bacterium]|nr:glycosyltransferase family 4 protein [Candidatus Binataceae bacterium]